MEVEAWERENLAAMALHLRCRLYLCRRRDLLHQQSVRGHEDHDFLPHTKRLIEQGQRLSGPELGAICRDDVLYHGEPGTGQEAPDHSGSPLGSGPRLRPRCHCVDDLQSEDGIGDVARVLEEGEEEAAEGE